MEFGARGREDDVNVSWAGRHGGEGGVLCLGGEMIGEGREGKVCALNRLRESVPVFVCCRLCISNLVMQAREKGGKM